MTLHSNNLSAVTANGLSGQLVTATNSAATGQETINDVLQPGTGGSVTYTVVGSAPYILVDPPADTSVARFAWSGLNLSTVSTRICWTPIGLPNVAEQIAQLRSTSALAAVLTATTGATPRLLLLAADGSTTLWTSTSATPLTAGTEYRIEVNVLALGTTTGQIQVKLYNGRTTSATLIDDSGPLTGVNLGAANIAVLRWGALNRAAADTSPGFRFRDMAYNDAGGFIGGVAAATTPPTVSLGGDVALEPFTPFTVPIAASDPAGGTLTYATTITNNTSASAITVSGASTSAPSFTTGGDWGVTGSQLTVHTVVTSSVTGLTASDDLIVSVRPQTAGWKQAGGAERASKTVLI